MSIFEDVVLVDYDTADQVVGVHPNRCVQCALEVDKCEWGVNCGSMVFIYKDDHEAWLRSRNEVPAPEESLWSQNHYTWRGGHDTLEFSIGHNLNFTQGCVLKYLYRYPHKNGRQDLEKALVYLRAADPVDSGISLEAATHYIGSNKFTWREGGVILTTLMGMTSTAIAHIEKLIEEVYGTEE